MGAVAAKNRSLKLATQTIYLRLIASVTLEALIGKAGLGPGKRVHYLARYIHQCSAWGCIYCAFRYTGPGKGCVGMQLSGVVFIIEVFVPGEVNK